MKKICILLLLFGFLSSCDEYVPYILDIDNQTNDTIKIVFLKESPYSIINPDSLYFPPKQKKCCGEWKDVQIAMVVIILALKEMK